MNIRITVLIILGVSIAACSGNEADKTVNATDGLLTRDATETNAVNTEPLVAAKEQPYPSKVYWGDTHLHTGLSGDAFALGNRLDSEAALRFARGESVISSTGQTAQLARPLDFLVIADHAEGLGTTLELYNGHPVLMADPTLARWAGMLKEGGQQAMLATREIIQSLASGTLPPPITDPAQVGPIIRNVWMRHGETVERYNEPGKFTAFMGFEYSSVPKGNNLHRVVVFRDGTQRTNSILPFSALQSDNPADLWQFLESYEKDTGGRALAIPHNPNLSNGHMFAQVDFEGRDMDATYARRRARWEPIVETTQIKGDSESHPFLSPNDEFAGFGDSGWEIGNLTLQTPKENSMLGGEYVREALKRGLSVQKETGVNPFKLGMIGSTDSHTSLSTADDDNFYGKNTQMEPGAKRAMMVHKRSPAGRGDLQILGWQYLAGGYAAVWATDNTRAALFDAMLRKEVYATTGPRMTLRFFGGWSFDDKDADTEDLAARGYAEGVPMGGDLPPRSTNEAPVLLIAASKDPLGANLDRAQVVKGWLDADGELHERVYDALWSDSDGQRKPDASGRLPAVGNTVDLATATWKDTIGSAELRGIWRDPDFNADEPAFYYVRVLEIPTPNWVARDAAKFNLDLPADVTRVIQARGYTSPIWYTPPNDA